MTEPHQSADTKPLPSHPVGTLAIVGLYGVLFAAGWLAFYFLVFRERGAVAP